MVHQPALDFARRAHRAVLATYRNDGTAQLSPVLVVVDGDGRLAVSSRETAIKTINLRRDPRAAVCVLNDGFYGEWHNLEGTVELLSLPEAMEPLVDYYRLAAGEHPDWEDYRRAMAAEGRVLIRITVLRSGPAHLG